MDRSPALAALGALMLAWGLFLLGGTGFFWWSFGSVFAGLLAVAAAVGMRAHRRASRGLAWAALFGFVAPNGVAGVLACTGGGLCAPTVVVLAVVGAGSLAILADRSGSGQRPS